jgi:hypothetical protein
MSESTVRAFLDRCSFHDTFIGAFQRALGGAPKPAIIQIPGADSVYQILFSAFSVKDAILQVDFEGRTCAYSI